LYIAQSTVDIVKQQAYAVPLNIKPSGRRGWGTIEVQGFGVNFQTKPVYVKRSCLGFQKTGMK